MEVFFLNLNLGVIFLALVSLAALWLGLDTALFSSDSSDLASLSQFNTISWAALVVILACLAPRLVSLVQGLASHLFSLARYS